MRFHVALCVFAVTFALATSSWAADPEKAQSRIDSARELYASGSWETAREAYEEAYKLAPEDSVLKAEAALENGSLLWEQGRYKEAEKQVKDALQRAKKLELENAIGRLMLTLGHIEASSGRLSDAEATLRICSRLADEQKDVHFAALCRINLRFVRQLRGRNPGPKSQYRRDLEKLKKSGEDLLVGTALAKIAELYASSGQYGVAKDYLDNAEVHFNKAQSVPAKARNRLRKAQLFQDQQRWDDSARELDGLVLLFRNMRSRPSLATAYLLAARQAEHTGDAKAAKKNYDSAIKVASSLGSPQLAGNAQLAVCEYYARIGKTTESSKACKKAENIFTSAGVPALAARAKITLARTAQLRGDYAQARDIYTQVIQALAKRAISDDDKRSLATQRVNLCQVELKLESNWTLARCKEALKDLKRIKARDADITRMRAITHYAVGVMAYNANRASESRKSLTEAARLFEEIEDPVRGAEAYLRLGRLQLRTGKLPAATKSLERSLSWLDKADKTRSEVQQIRVQARIQLTQVKMDSEAWSDAKSAATELVTEAAIYKDTASAAWGYSALARAELKLKNRDGAIAALKKGITYAGKAGDKELEANLRENLKKFK